jgi:hypothetical protein
MKTLADFKRRLVVGAKLRVTFHMGPMVIRGNLGDTILPAKPPEDRVVAKVQSNAIAFSRPQSDDPMRLSWLEYPKAREFSVDSAGHAIISGEDGKKRLEYEFI